MLVAKHALFCNFPLALVFQSILKVGTKGVTKSSTLNLRDRYIPDDLLLGNDSAAWLSLYVAEARELDGSPFPPKSLYLLLTGLLRHMRSKNPNCPNFIETNQPEFISLHNAMDNVFRKLRAEGVQADSVKVLKPLANRQLWDSGSLSTETPKGLLPAVFFNNGLSFCLRGGEEHRNLRLSQLKRESDPPRYVYIELASKNRAGGLAQFRVKNIYFC